MQLELESRMLCFTAGAFADGAVSLDELDGFSEELQNMVRVLYKRIELEEQQNQ